MQPIETDPATTAADGEYLAHRNYWLSHCEGFTVEDIRGGRLGRVAAVEFGSQADRPAELVVCCGRVRLRWSVVEADDVAVIVPRDMRLRLRQRASDSLTARSAARRRRVGAAGGRAASAPSPGATVAA